MTLTHLLPKVGFRPMLALGLALSAVALLAACDSPDESAPAGGRKDAKGQASVIAVTAGTVSLASNPALAERVNALEADLASQELLIGQMQQQQHDQFNQANALSQKIAAELADVKRAMGAPGTVSRLSPVPADAAAETPGVKAPAEQAKHAASDGGPGFFSRLARVIVLLVVVFLAFKALGRWQEHDGLDDDGNDAAFAPASAARPASAERAAAVSPEAAPPAPEPGLAAPAEPEAPLSAPAAAPAPGDDDAASSQE
jgi:hypothetical protein